MVELFKISPQDANSKTSHYKRRRQTPKSAAGIRATIENSARKSAWRLDPNDHANRTSRPRN
jgi:hypothetical protein